MKKSFWLLPVALPSLLISFPAFAADTDIEQKNSNKSKVTSDIQSLSEIALPTTSAELLTQESAPDEVEQETQPDAEPETEPTH